MINEKNKTLNIGGRLLLLEQAAVMGILNVTPDSFYEGSRAQDERTIKQSVERFISEGVDIIDLGAVSTRPGAEDVDSAEELERLQRAVAWVREVSEDVPLSVDTFRADVVERLSDCFGGFVVNDISGGQFDARMYGVVAQRGLPYIMGHIKGTPQTMATQANYTDLMEELMSYFVQHLAQAREAGIKDVIIDPCFGFAKNINQNFELLDKYDQLSLLGCPVMAALSRKSMIYRTLGTTPVSELTLAGTNALHWQALQNGADILRVHDVAQARAVVTLWTKMKQNI